MTDDKSSKGLTLAQKIAAANHDIGPISANGKNTHQNYVFQTEADIKAAVRKVCAKYNFVIIPTFEILKKYERQTKYGGTMTFYDVMGKFHITDGKESIDGAMPGTGSDSGDKALQKACTSAQKYFYKQIFNITDRDEDPDTTDSKPNGGYAAQRPKQHAKPMKKYSESELLAMQVKYGQKKVNMWTVYNAAFNAKDAEAQNWWKYWYERPDTDEGNLVRQYSEFAKKKQKQGEQELKESTGD